MRDVHENSCCGASRRAGALMTTRREFLRAAAGTAGLVVAFRLSDVAAFGSKTVFDPNAYLQIDEDGVVTLWVTRLEMGQGVRTLLPMILAEELEADWSRVRIEQASPGARFAGIELHTSGSGSSSGSYRRLRSAAATAREVLIRAAANSWKVGPERASRAQEPSSMCRRDGAVPMGRWWKRRLGSSRPTAPR